MRMKPECREQYVFLAYNPEELATIPAYVPPFRHGDILAKVYRRHEEGDCFTVVRFRDDVVDGVFPEEVERLV